MSNSGMYQPVNGNNCFTVVNSLAGQIANLDVSNVNAVSLTVENLNTSTISSQLLPGLGLTKSGKIHQVILYAPIGFNTGIVNSIWFFNTQPHSEHGGSSMFVLPKGSQVYSATCTNNGTTIASGGLSTFDIGYESYINHAQVGGAQIFATLPLATINTGGYAGPLASSLALGTAGNVFALPAVTTGEMNVTIQVLTFPNTAGDAALLLSYLL